MTPLVELPLLDSAASDESQPAGENQLSRSSLLQRGICSGYRCPGESQPITRALHLSRLAAGHQACPSCLYREETGLLPRQIADRARSRTHRQEIPLITADGIRGRYVNQLTRERMADIVKHVLEMVDAARAASETGPGQGGLRIVTGYDSRPTSPDLAIGVVATMRKWGCDIVDAGLLSRPAFDLVVARFRPDAGLYLTGGNRSHSWSGLDVIDHAGLPWCLPGKLEELSQALQFPANRIGRSQGRYESIRITDDYLAALTQQFHAIRPLRLAVMCPDQWIRNTLREQLAQTSCSVHFLPGNTLAEKADRRFKPLIDLLCERRLDVGFFIGHDGRTCHVFDEGGHELSLPETLALLMQLPMENLNPAPEYSTSHQQTQADLLRDQRERQIPIVADGEHRYWFRDELPACDAILTLAKVLEVLSFSERPVSTYRRNRAEQDCEPLPEMRKLFYENE